MEQRTLFCDMTRGYLIPEEPREGDAVTFRFRTGRFQASAVKLCFPNRVIDLEWESQKNNFDYYSTQTVIGEERLEYYFEIHAENTLCYYGKTGVAFSAQDVVPFEIIPGFAIPKWLRGAVMYQIYTDRFSSAGSSNDVSDGEYLYYEHPVRRVSDWNELPEAFDVGNFHGGDLQGIIEKLDYLQGLGVEVLYLNPVFVSPSNHKYDIQDYDHVDAHLGDMPYPEKGRLAPENLEAADETLKRLIEAVHARGMKIILDGVFNHCSHMSPWMDVPGDYRDEKGGLTGAYANPGSPYDSYFEFEDEEHTLYDCWWDNTNLPKLNYEASPALFHEILRVGAKWVSPPFNADGWRLDVASDLGHSPAFNHMFWQEFRKAVKGANPDAVIIAEHYDNASPWLDGSQWDTVMNYRAFMDPVSWYFTGMEKHSDRSLDYMYANSEMFEAAMTPCGAEFTGQSLFCAMNQLDNHDHSRFITRTNHRVMRLDGTNHALAGEGVDINIYKMAVLMQMTWPGAPCLYYGDETALPGFTDPDNRRAYPWDSQDVRMIDFYKQVISLRKEYPFLRDCSCKVIHARGGVLAFARFTDDEHIVAVFSMEDEESCAELPMWIVGRAGYRSADAVTRILEIKDGEEDFAKVEYAMQYGLLKIKLPPRYAAVFYGN